MNLFNEFIRAGVRQVGRDGGRVISNKIYKGQHGTPIYNSGSYNNNEAGNSFDSGESIQFKNNNPILVFLKGLFIQIIPFYSIGIIIRSIEYLTRKNAPIYDLIPTYTSDRRYKTGVRQSGYNQKKIGSRPLNEVEIKYYRKRGIVYSISLVPWIIFWVIVINGLNSVDDTVVGKKGVIINSEVKLRIMPNIDSESIKIIRKKDTVKIIELGDKSMALDGVKSKWYKVQSNKDTGWVWGGYIQELN